MLGIHLKGLQHLGLPVADIDRSIRWYRELLGFELVYETQIPEGEGITKVAFMKQKGFVIEMYQLSGRELEEIRQRGHGHIDHIALDVDDIDEIYLKLKNAGFEALEGEPRFLPFWDKGVRFLTILGPDNEKVEFNQYL